MSIQDNKSVVHRFIEAFNAGDLDRAAAVCAPSIVVHNSGSPDPMDLEGFKQFGRVFLVAFPDGKETVEDTVCEGDRVVTRFIFRGTHTRELMGIPPTGRPVAVSAMTIDKIGDGKIVESWRLFDQTGMMQQLGLLPVPGQPG